MKIYMVVERTKTGYSAYATNFPVYTTGKSMEELKRNIHEALNLYFETINHKKRAAINAALFPPPSGGRGH